jgi:hypothetical protein
MLTVRSSAIIKKLEKTFIRDDSKTKVLARWYFRFDLDDTKRMDLFLVSLLRQLASQCQGFPNDKSLKWFRHHQTNSGQLPDDTNELFGHLKKFISKVSKDVFIVLDGLDQVPDRQRATKSGPLKVLDIIKRLMGQGYPNLHVLVVSRDEKDIHMFLADMDDMVDMVSVEEGLCNDLDKFIDRKLEDMQVLKGSQSLKGDVKRRLNPRYCQTPLPSLSPLILTHLRSNFLWAASVLAQISQCREAEEIQEALGKIPDSVVGIYQDALEKVPVKDTNRMKSILLWMLNQLRPLSQTELAAAIGLRSATEVIEICTRVLLQTSIQLTVMPRGARLLWVFRFTHSSVKEYLEAVVSGKLERPETKADNLKITRFERLPAEDAHFQITRRCLDILSACSSESSQKRKTAAGESGSDSDSDDTLSCHRKVVSESEFDGSETDDSASNSSSSTADYECAEGPAREYAAEFWFRHYNLIDRNKVSSRQLKVLDREVCSLLLLDKNKTRFWLKTYDPDGGMRPRRDMPSPVYYAVKLELKGIPAQLIALTEPDDRLKMLDWRGNEGTALQLAAARGDWAALDALIHHGADVNSERGPHGTALYVSAARGDVTAVEKLLKAGADPSVTDDGGDLGSPLHVAAFRGFDTVIRLLLEIGDVDVDHRAGPFGTALQAASALRQATTIKLLLGEGADPNIVGGCLGTAAQAAFAHPMHGSTDKEIDNLLFSKGQLVDGPGFWKTAYERAILHDWGRLDESRLVTTPSRKLFANFFTELLLTQRMPGMAGLVRPGPGPEQGLPERQQLLAVVIRQWALPEAKFPSASHLFSGWVLHCRVPFQDQLDAIRRAVPQQELTMQHLRHKDFMHKALFWAGVNYALGKLPELIQLSMHETQSILYVEYLRSGRHSAPASLPFRWVFGPEDCEDGYWRFHGDIDDHPDRKEFAEKNLIAGDKPVVRSAIRSDLVAIELMQQRQRQKRLEEVYPPVLGDYGRDRGSDVGDKNQGDAKVREELRSASQSGVYVTSDVCDLVRHLITYGDRCVRYQDAASDPAMTAQASRYRGHIEDLTYELFSAVMRLALALSDYKHKFSRLAYPLRLLTTVRLERIKELDAICERAFQPRCTCNHACAQDKPDAKVQEMAAAVARQVEQTLGDKLALETTGLVSEIQSHVSSVLKQEMLSLVEEVQKGLEEKVRQEVHRQLAEAQESQQRRGLLW